MVGGWPKCGRVADGNNDGIGDFEGLTQKQVADRMGVSTARVSQIEAGDVSTQDVLTRYIAALGGTLKLIADFGDEQMKVA